MKALGMIEVYGYLTAVEALDSALKAANVTRLDVVKVRGGLVTVLVEGDVGAVKAAMDASAAAAERIGTVVSVHVIPRPASDVERMLKGPGGGSKADPPKAEPEPKEPEPKEPEPEKLKAEEPKAEQPEADLEPETPEPEAPEPEEPAQAAMPEPAEPERKPEEGKAAAVTPEEMKAMSVDGLRRLARELEIPSMTRAEIRYAKKQELIQKITEFIDS